MFQRSLLLLAFASHLLGADQITFAAGTHYAVETDSTVPLTLVRNGNLMGEASVQVALNPYGFLTSFTAAVAGTDHAFTTTMVTFAAGQRLATVGVPILADTVADGNRFVALTLGSPVNAVIGTGGEYGLSAAATIGIFDDETAGGAPLLLINPIDTYNSYFAETARTIRVPVLRQGATTDALTATWTIADGSGAITPLTGTLTWAAGEGGTRYVDAALTNTPGDDRNRSCLLTVTSGGTTATHTINVLDAVGLPGGFIETSGLMQYVVEEPSGAPTTVSCWFERISGTAGAVTMNVALYNQAQASDVTLLTTSLTWADGESGRKAVLLQVLPDDLAESSEYIDLALSLDAGSRASFPGYAEVTRTSWRPALHILPNDLSPDQSWLGFTSTQWAAVEGGTTTIAIERFGNLAATASATFTISNSSSQDADWSAVASTGTLSWAAGEGGLRTVTFSAVQDALSEPEELVRVRLSNLSGATLSGNDSVEVSILDDDFRGWGNISELSRIECQIIGFTHTVTEGRAATMVLRRTGPAPEAASVTLVPAAGTALPGSDFPLAPVTVTWAAGETGDRIALIPTINDETLEPTEYFSVWISAPVGAATLVGNTQFNINIVDDDGGSANPEFVWETVTSGAIDEGVGQVTVNLVRRGGSGPVSIQWTVRTSTDAWGYLASTADINGPTSGTLHWIAGEDGAKAITIGIVDDVLVDRGFGLCITAIPQAGEPVSFSSMSTTVWINDNDGPQQHVEYVGVMGVPETVNLIPEGGTHTITLRRTGHHSGPLSVLVTGFNGGGNVAILGVDYTLSALSVSWADGDLADKTITLTALTDILTREPDEEIIIYFGVESGNAQVTSYYHHSDNTLLWSIFSRFSAKLVNQADSAAGDILATSSQTVFTEGVDSALVLTLGRVGGASGAVTVSYATLMESLVDEARQGSDYTPVAGTVTWADGDSAAKTISIPLLDDALVEFPERVRLYLALTTGQARTVVPGWIFSIADNDANVVTPGISFASAGTSHPETGGALTVTVQRTGALTGTASVDLTVSGSATLGADYALSATTISFAAGAATAAITLTPVDDGAGDPGETVVLTLVNPSAGLVLLAPSAFTATLSEVVDTTAPTVAVTTVGGRTPAGGAVTVARSPAAVVIAASDDVAVHQVTATLNGNAVTVAAAGSGWQIAALPLALGANTLVVTARDAAGNEAQASVAVTFRPTQTFTLHDTYVASGSGAPVTTTPALLGLAAGDLRRFDPSTKTLVDVPADAELTPGAAYTLKEGVSAPTLPPADHDAVPVTAGRLNGLAQGWNLRTVTGGQAAEWSPDTVTAVIDGAPAVTLAQAIAAGQLRPYCWAYNPADGSVRLITRDPAKVPGSSSTIPAGWNVWLPSGHGGTIQLIFSPAGRS